MESSNIKWECEWRTLQGMVEKKMGKDYSVLAKIYIQCNKQDTYIYIFIGIKYVDIGLNMS